jgi:hypothetical protein
MRNLLFRNGAEIVSIKISDAVITFAKLQGQFLRYTTIDGLKLSLSGILIEFPELEGKPADEIRIEAIKRFKAKCMELATDDAIEQYIVADLAKHGYEFLIRQKAGWRAEVIKRI